jgi:hypothetical protein
MFSDLLRSIADRDRRTCAERILKELKGSEQLDALGRKNLFERVVANESQRVLNLMRHIVDDMKRHPETRSLAPLTWGVSSQARSFLHCACSSFGSEA